MTVQALGALMDWIYTICFDHRSVSDTDKVFDKKFNFFQPFIQNVAFYEI